MAARSKMAMLHLWNDTHYIAMKVKKICVRVLARTVILHNSDRNIFVRLKRFFSLFLRCLPFGVKKKVVGVMISL